MKLIQWLRKLFKRRTAEDFNFLQPAMLKAVTSLELGEMLLRELQREDSKPWIPVERDPKVVLASRNISLYTMLPCAYHTLPWTQLQDKILETLTGEKSDKWVAANLGRTVRAIQQRRYKLNRAKKKIVLRPLEFPHIPSTTSTGY